MENPKPEPIDTSVFKDVLKSLQRQVIRLVIEDLALAILSYTVWIMSMMKTQTFYPFVPVSGFMDKPIFETNLYLRPTSIVYLFFIFFLTVTGILVLLGTILERRALLFIWYLSHSLVVFVAAGFLIFIVLYLPITDSINYIVILIGPICYRAGRIGYVRSYQVALDYFKSKGKGEDTTAYFQGSDLYPNSPKTDVFEQPKLEVELPVCSKSYESDREINSHNANEVGHETPTMVSTVRQKQITQRFVCLSGPKDKLSPPFTSRQNLERNGFGEKIVTYNAGATEEEVKAAIKRAFPKCQGIAFEIFRASSVGYNQPLERVSISTGIHNARTRLEALRSDSVFYIRPLVEIVLKEFELEEKVEELSYISCRSVVNSDVRLKGQLNSVSTDARKEDAELATETSTSKEKEICTEKNEVSLPNPTEPLSRNEVLPEVPNHRCTRNANTRDAIRVTDPELMTVMDNVFRMAERLRLRNIVEQGRRVSVQLRERIRERERVMEPA